MDSYLLFKWLHILSSTVLFGTGLGTAFQMVWAMRTGRVETIHSVASAVVIADWLFTAPAGLVQPLSGLMLARLQGRPLSDDWLLLTYAAYVLAFLCWAPVVYLQIRIRDLAAESLQAARSLPMAAWRAYRLWFALGWPGFLSLVGIFWLMVAKPDFGW